MGESRSSHAAALAAEGILPAGISSSIGTNADVAPTKKGRPVPPLFRKDRLRSDYFLDVRQPSAYVSRATLLNGTGDTRTCTSSCLWRSTVTFFVPPFGSPQTSVRSSPSFTSGFTQPSVRARRSL